MKTRLRNLWGAWGLLAAGLIVTVLISLHIKAGAETAARREFDFTCNEIQLNINARLAAAAQILSSGAALFDASETVSREEWRTFTQRLQIEQQLPGIQGIGFALLIPREQLARHIQEIRREGFPDYQVTPAGERESYSVIIYLEPFSDRNLRAFGYDMLSEPVRCAAMERARDENIAALSGKVILVQETSQNVQAGALIYVPVYRHGLPIETIEQRRAAIQGWVYSPYRITDLMRGTLRGWDVKQKGKQIYLQVYDGDVLSADTLLYDSWSAGDRALASSALVTRLTPVDFAGRRWTLRFTQPSGLASSVDYGSVWLVLLGGTIINLLLFGLILSLINMRVNAQQLRESEEKHRLVVDNASEVIIVIQDEMVQLVNPGLMAMLGFSEQELKSSPFPSFVHPDDRAMVADRHQKMMQGETVPTRYSFRLITKDGNTRWVETNVAQITWKGCPAALALLGDITERKHADEQVHTLLAESNQARLSLLGIIEDQARAEDDLKRLATAVEQAAEIIVITDAQGLIQYVNQAFETVTGYTREEAIGQNSRILKSGRQDEAFYRELWETIRSGKTWQGRFVNRKKDGALYTEEATISPVHDAAGAIINYSAVKRDITAELNTQAQLNQAQKMESVGLLAGGVAHDFNNMLQIIMGNADLAANRLGPADPIRSELDEIQNAGRRATDLTRQLLAFARQQTISPRTLDLNEVVENMLKMLRRLIGENIELAWAPRANLWPVRLDPGQVDQIMANLCVNARDAIDGVGAVHIATENVRVDELLAVRHEDFLPGDYVLLTVSDTGCGMNAETQSRIFEPFFTTKELGKGTGLGLATVYGIVRQNKGHIGVYSEPGKGTTFRIHLPRYMGKDVVHIKEGAAQPVARGSETVLLVEDDRAILDMCGRILRNLGYSVLAADTPEAALRMAEEHADKIRLLVTDVVMPGMNGRELAGRMKARCPHLKCLYMSGFTADVIARQGVLDEGVNFIQKPFSMADLAAKVREALAGA